MSFSKMQKAIIQRKCLNELNKASLKAPFWESLLPSYENYNDTEVQCCKNT